MPLSIFYCSQLEFYVTVNGKKYGSLTTEYK